MKPREHQPAARPEWSDEFELAETFTRDTGVAIGLNEIHYLSSTGKLTVVARQPKSSRRVFVRADALRVLRAYKGIVGDNTDMEKRS